MDSLEWIASAIEFAIINATLAGLRIVASIDDAQFMALLSIAAALIGTLAVSFVAVKESISDKCIGLGSRNVAGPTEETVRVRHEVLRQIYEEIGTRPAEHGGVLGGDLESGIVTHFWFDEQAHRSGSIYTPEIDRVNELIDGPWKEQGISFFGFGHSHPVHCRHLSAGDEKYIREILRAKKSLNRLLVPIVISEADGAEYELLFWIAESDGFGIRTRLLPVTAVDEAGNAVEVDNNGVLVDRLIDMDAIAARLLTDAVATARSRTCVTVADSFNRVESAYDLSRNARSRLFFAGVGGMRATIPQLARAGVEEFVLVDPGIYEEANLGTQPCFRDEIGTAKVDAVRTEVLLINPNARVIALECKLDDLDDEAIRSLAMKPMLSVPVPGRGKRTWIDLQPDMTVLVGGTDNFYAQARINRLGLKLGLPTMLSAVYESGVGAELTWTHPDVSRACHRCALWCRYQAHLKKGYKNTVTSHGTPIFATQRLSALEMIILMALVHHGTDHPRLGCLLERIGQRNLLQIRLDPEFSTKLGLRVFDKVFADADKERLLCDETVWLPQAPEDGTNGRPKCSECGGTGNLRACIGKFVDTRVMCI